MKVGSPATLRKLATALDVSFAWLAFGDGDAPVESTDRPSATGTEG